MAFEDNCMETNNARSILSVTEMFSRDSSFWQYKVCLDICRGSVEKGIKKQWDCA